MNGAASRLAGIAILGCALALSACGSPEEKTRERYPVVVVVTFDTLSMAVLEDMRGSTEAAGAPKAAEEIWGLADRGVYFENSWTTVPQTLPAHATLFTGRLPEDHGVLLNGDAAPPELDTLAERFAAAGYRTVAVPSLAVLHREFGLAQGFDVYRDEGLEAGTRWYRSAQEVLSIAREEIEQAAGEPLFLWVHLSDPHEPYLAPGLPADARLLLDGEPLGDFQLASAERFRVEVEFPPGASRLEWLALDMPEGSYQPKHILLEVGGRGLRGLVETETKQRLETTLDSGSFSIELSNQREKSVSRTVSFRGRLRWPPRPFVWDNYRKEVLEIDRALGGLRQAVQATYGEETALWTVVSDHGEGLYRKGVLGHAPYVHEDQLRIFWALSGRGVPEGHRIEGYDAVNADVAATLLSVVGLPLEQVEGVDWSSCWKGDQTCPEPRRRRTAYGASVGSRVLSGFAAYRGRYKLSWGSKRSPRIYDLAADPWEKTDLTTSFRAPGATVPSEVQELEADFERLRASLAERLMAPREEMSEEGQRMLEAVGYLGN